MGMSLKTGGFSINKYGEDHYDIRISNSFDNSKSHINFLKRDELKRIMDEINRVLKDGECADVYDCRADAEQTSGMESVMEC